MTALFLNDTIEYAFSRIYRKLAYVVWARPRYFSQKLTVTLQLNIVRNEGFSEFLSRYSFLILWHFWQNFLTFWHFQFRVLSKYALSSDLITFLLQFLQIFVVKSFSISKCMSHFRINGLFKRLIFRFFVDGGQFLFTLHGWLVFS